MTTIKKRNVRIDETEAEIDAGVPGITHEELMQKTRNMIAGS